MISRCTHRHAPNEGKEKKCKNHSPVNSICHSHIVANPHEIRVKIPQIYAMFFEFGVTLIILKHALSSYPGFFFCTNDKQIIKKTHRQKDREENKQTKKQILSTRCFLLALCALITLEPLRFNRVQNSKACINVRWCLASVLGTSSLMRLEPKSGCAGRPSLHTRLQSNWI